jgi:ribosomal protein L31
MNHAEYIIDIVFNYMYNMERRKNMIKGSKQTAAAKEKMSLAQKKRFRIKENHPQWGCKHTEERSRKQRETFNERYPAGPTHFNFGKRRSKESREKMRMAKLGKYLGPNHHSWRGGIWHQEKGYIGILSPNHPYRGVRGYVLEHRLVVESFLKRFLNGKKEPVHHLNKIKNDNRPENLIAFASQTAHNNFEDGITIKESDILFDGRSIKH